MAGAVQNTPSLFAWSGVSFQCDRNASQTSTAPVKAPKICAIQKGTTFVQLCDVIATTIPKNPMGSTRCTMSQA